MRLAARVAALAWLAVVLVLTLSPHNTQSQARGDRVVAKAKQHVNLPGRVPRKVQRQETDIIGNVVLFIPVGALGSLAFPGRRRAVIWFGVSLSAAIELIQLGYLPHRNASVRDASVRDVSLNSLGHVVGVGVAAAIGRISTNQWK